VSTQVYRVVVRGAFDGLSDERRGVLRDALADHEIFRAAYTADGTLTYEANLHAFSYRFEVRLRTEPGDDPDRARQDAIDVAMGKAAAHLDASGLGHKHLRATATDMATLWHDDDGGDDEAADGEGQGEGDGEGETADGEGQGEGPGGVAREGRTAGEERTR
jgi:hypothetical protein